jgi:glucose/arabinose dehydrogenase
MRRALVFTITLSLAALISGSPPARSQVAGPEMLHPRLGVRTVIGGLITPIGLAFLGPRDMLVLEKQTGHVLRVQNGAVTGTVLDLAVNNASERGLLSITLHPQFGSNGFVYLYWSCRTPGPGPDLFTPPAQRCDETAMLGADTDDILAVPLLGNRVDRFVWDGSTLTFDRNIIQLRAFQSDGGPEPPGQGDAGQPPRGNHDGGVIDFGPDGKLYVVVGDLGRRGQLQNLPGGPLGDGSPDDQFGGPEPDDAHLSGVILRLDDDGSAPSDNPFFAAGATMGGEAGANVQKIFAYGLRNSFGMAFDPVSGALWEQENGDDTFSELNRADRGFNSGWIQIMGPASRIGQYKEIETTFGSQNLQQLRWPPTNIADSPAEALSRLFMLPGARFSDPELSWKWEVAPAGIAFVDGGGLGRQFRGDLFMGAARDTLEGGHLFHFDLTGNRRQIAVDDPRLEDRVADNNFKFDITESESLLIGRNFGIVPDIETGPNGHLFLASLTNGEIYEIFPR